MLLIVSDELLLPHLNTVKTLCFGLPFLQNFRNVIGKETGGDANDSFNALSATVGGGITTRRGSSDANDSFNALSTTVWGGITTRRGSGDANDSFNTLSATVGGGITTRRGISDANESFTLPATVGRGITTHRGSSDANDSFNALPPSMGGQTVTSRRGGGDDPDGAELVPFSQLRKFSWCHFLNCESC